MLSVAQRKGQAMRIFAPVGLAKLGAVPGNRRFDDGLGGDDERMVVLEYIERLNEAYELLSEAQKVFLIVEPVPVEPA